jgi:hypothetical protein
MIAGKDYTLEMVGMWPTTIYPLPGEAEDAGIEDVSLNIKKLNTTQIPSRFFGKRRNI